MLRRLRKYFFSGLAVFLPVVLTVYVFIWVLNFAENILGRYLKPLLLERYDFYFWGLGIVGLLLLIIFAGFLVANYFGRSIHRLTEQVLLNIPVISSIYPAFKEISRFVFREEVNKLGQVVMIQWPRQGIYTIGFLTNKTTPRIADAAGKKLCNVMVPTVPNPLTGFIAMIPEEEITPLNISVEEAIKIVVSGGVLNAGDTENKSPDVDIP